jgi:hypothetical protein
MAVLFFLLTLIAYRGLQIPGDAPFELQPSPGKGWGAFATRRIERGAMILRETPLFVIRKLCQDIREEDVQLAFYQLTPHEKQQFLCLRDNSSKSFTSMSKALAENSFAISINPLIPGVFGLFLLLSRFNHSCVPNAKVPECGEEIIAIFATKDIAAGEEITFCYDTIFECRTRLDRRQRLRFVCECKACLPGTAFQQLSDVRRILIRGLQCLLLGEDVSTCNRDPEHSTSAIILDPELKKVAEDFNIPLSARLIYELLVVYLLEEEGFLDHFLVGRLRQAMMWTAASLKTESNSRIVRLAMEQETWLGKLCVAFRLYGRGDAADCEVAVKLRLLRERSVNS